MRKIFSKKVVTTTIESSAVKFENGVPTATPNEPITESGKLTEEKAQEIATSHFGLGTVVTNLVLDEKIYRFNILDILEYALPEDEKVDAEELEETEA